MRARTKSGSHLGATRGAVEPLVSPLPLGPVQMRMVASATVSSAKMWHTYITRQDQAACCRGLGGCCALVEIVRMVFVQRGDLALVYGHSAVPVAHDRGAGVVVMGSF